VTIIGGLLFSQVLTLYTTPVVYLYMDKMHTLGQRIWRFTTARPTELRK